jgi:hypothetical protein
MNQAFSKKFITIMSAVFFLTACVSQKETSEIAESAEIAESVEIAESAETFRTASASKSDLICRREHQTGSHFKRRICRTREEMELVYKETREMLESLPPGQGIGGLQQ